MILAIVLKTSIVLVLAALIAKLLQKRGKNSELVWLTALISALAIPVVSVLLPVWQVQILPSPAQPESHEVPVVQVPVKAVDIPIARSLKVQKLEKEPVTRIEAPVIAAVKPDISKPGKSDVPILLIVWAAGVAVVSARMCSGLLRLRRFRKDSEILDVTDFVFDGHTAAELAGYAGKWELRRSRTQLPSGPLTWGLFRPIVILPQSSITWSRHRQEVVLLHELAHVRRRDGISAFIAECACVVYWFNPLVWVGARALRDESERAADVAVVQSGIPAAVYAEELLQAAIDFKYQVRPRNMPGAQAMTSPKLENRLRAILAAETVAATRPRKWLVLAALLSATTIPAIAAFQAVPKNSPERQTALQHAKALALATVMYSHDYDSYFPNAKSDAAAWNRVRFYLKSKPPVEAPKSMGNFHFNRKISRVSSEQIPSPSKTPVWYEVLSDKDTPFAVAFADGHAKLIEPSDRAIFVKQLSQNFSQAQGLHIELNAGEAQFLMRYQNIVRRYKKLKSSPNKLPPSVRANVLKKYIELRKMDEMKANTFDLQKKARLQVFEAQKQLDKLQLRKQINDSMQQQSNDLLRRSLSEKGGEISPEQLETLQKSIELSQKIMSKGLSEDIARSLEQARKTGSPALIPDQIKIIHDHVSAAKTAELRRNPKSPCGSKGCKRSWSLPG